MGTMQCTSRPEKSILINNELKVLQKEIKKQIKILLLGPGESGKSTIFKQMKIIQDNGGFSELELRSFKGDIYTNCVSQMKCILEAAASLHIKFSNKELVEYAHAIIKHSGNIWTKELGIMIKALWKDPGIQETYSKRGSLYQLNDTANYFFDNIDRINDEEYLPTANDVLRVRVKSAGIEEAEFVFDRRLYRVVDVGGQRSERRKWIHCFNDVTAVLFCASLAGYDLPLREDPRRNRLTEAITLFGEVTNQETFRNKAIIFFLNKTDLLQEKLPFSPLEAYQKSYIPPDKDIKEDPDCHFKAASEFIRKLFLEKIDKKQRELKTVFVHYTCALDTEQVEIVIKSVRVWLLEDILIDMGMGV